MQFHLFFSLHTENQHQLKLVRSPPLLTRVAEAEYEDHLGEYVYEALQKRKRLLNRADGTTKNDRQTRSCMQQSKKQYNKNPLLRNCMTSSALRKLHLTRITILTLFAVLGTTIIATRLVYLQIVRYRYYTNVAQAEHQGYSELPARRGEILIEDMQSGEEFKLATNTTFDLVYADPTLIPDKTLVTEALAPLLFDKEKERTAETERVTSLQKAATTEEERTGIIAKTDDELYSAYKTEFLDSISREIRDQILLKTTMDEGLIGKITSMNLSGVAVIDQNLYVYPPQIADKEKLAAQLAPLIDYEAKDLARLLYGKNRYVILKRKLATEISAQITDMIKNDPEHFLGVRLKEEYYRFYPENNLAAQILGYTNNSGVGIYGIEQSFNTELEGKKGFFTSQIDGVGKQITVGESVIQPAQDGDNIVLTIDRSVQRFVENALADAVEEYKADNGQVIIMNPQNGEIIAMAMYPTFNPNSYGDALAMEDIELTPEEITNLEPSGEADENHLILYTDRETDHKIDIFRDTENPNRYYKYANTVGPFVYKNPTVTDTYEPGSTFKVITMAAGLDSGEVTPSTMYNDTGPVKVDEFEIKNATGNYYGYISMTDGLKKSLNTVLSFVAKKLGRSLFYHYIKAFGFNERTDIEFENEATGIVEYFEDWSNSELLTHSFGQGLTVTPLQLIIAMSAIANGGTLMQPTIIKKIQHADGKITTQEPKPIRQVITQETAEQLKAMLVAAVESGVAARAQVAGHYVGGKTGTAQTYKNGKPLSGIGTTIVNFIGFGPIDKPQFTILIKFDYPRNSEWADASTAPLAAKIFENLFTYYNIAPDK